MQKRFNIVALQFVATVERVELDHEAEAAYATAKLLDQLRRGSSGPAGSQHVVDDQHVMPRFYRVAMHLEAIRSVFEREFHALRGSRQFLGFAHRDKSRAQGI